MGGEYIQISFYTLIYITAHQFIVSRNLPMSGDFDDSHPARKIDPGELIKVLAERNKDVPAVTRSVIATSFPQAQPQTVSDNLDSLAEAESICMFHDGNNKVYWVPREDEGGGIVDYSEVLDDSIDWDDIEAAEVPTDKAEEIASERLKYYRPRSFWTNMTNYAQMVVFSSFGLVILGIGGLLADTLGMAQSTAAILYTVGIWAALFGLIGYLISLILDNLAHWGYVPKDPKPYLKKIGKRVNLF